MHNLFIASVVFSFTIFCTNLTAHTFRKVLFATVLALHLTPSRRLKACLEKYQTCRPHRKGGHIVDAVLTLLQGWSNGAEDLAKLVGAFRDEDDLVVSGNVDKVLKLLMEELSFSRDSRVQEFVHRHELKYSVSTTYTAECHLTSVPVRRHEFIDTTLHLRRAAAEGEVISGGDLNRFIEEKKSVTCEDKCPRYPYCESKVIKRMERFIEEACDPDFLTLYFSSPQTLEEIETELAFSNNNYSIKSIIHWDPKTNKAAVSAERRDGWSWFGVDNSQVQECTYSPARLHKVIALMCVRSTTQDASSKGGSSHASKTEEIKDFSFDFGQFILPSEPEIISQVNKN